METLIVVLILSLILGSAVITGLKGKYGFVAGGIIFHWFWIIGAIRVAKPDSFWARKFYSVGSAKQATADQRFGGNGKHRTGILT